MSQTSKPILSTADTNTLPCYGGKNSFLYSLGKYFFSSCLIQTTKAVVEANGGKVVVGMQELTSQYNESFYDDSDESGFNRLGMLRYKTKKALELYTKHTKIDLKLLADEIVEEANKKLEAKGLGSKFNEAIDPMNFLADFVLLQMHNVGKLSFSNDKQFYADLKSTFTQLTTDYYVANPTEAKVERDDIKYDSAMTKQVAHRLETQKSSFGQDLLVKEALEHVHSSRFQTKAGAVKEAVKETFFKVLKTSFFNTAEFATETILGLLTGYTIDIQQAPKTAEPDMGQYITTTTSTLVDSSETTSHPNAIEAWVDTDDTKPTDEFGGMNYADLIVGSGIQVEGDVQGDLNVTVVGTTEIASEA